MDGLGCVVLLGEDEDLSYPERSPVVLKPEEQQLIAGIITERDYTWKIMAQGRSSQYTKVGAAMTNEKQLITVSSDTNILQAMQLINDW
ncbi:hypothetical protein SAY87_012023 [Trapa incisa]|uniref:Uncharacterized protein n=1 Tax=Trapa incisa TaxID=236973 RepID=A0AAN7GK70_9MYRT|nr:hypothetical protein SAY87_012023 [Trapa incisa]